MPNFGFPKFFAKSGQSTSGPFQNLRTTMQIGQLRHEQSSASHHVSRTRLRAFCNSALAPAVNSLISAAMVTRSKPHSTARAA